MSPLLIGFSAGFGGWCGTGWIQYVIWYILHFGHPPPRPDPNPWWSLALPTRVLGLVIGAAAGLALYRLAGLQAATFTDVAAAGVVGFGAGFVVLDVAAQFGLRGRAADVQGRTAALR